MMFVFLLLFATLLISQIQLIHLGYGVEHDSYFADINHKIDLEYEVKFNRHFAVAAAASMSAGNLGWDIHKDYHHLLPKEYSRVAQVNAIMFWSPWRNNRINNFKIGLGVSAVHVRSKYIEYAELEKNVLVNYKEILFNEPGVYPIIAVENDIRINQKFLLGIKLQANFKGIESNPTLPQTFVIKTAGLIDSATQYRGSNFIGAAMIRLGFFL